MLNEAIRLSELALPEGAEIPGFDAENDQMVVSVNAPRAEEAEVEIEADVADGETSSEDDAGASGDSEGSDESDKNS